MILPGLMHGVPQSRLVPPTLTFRSAAASSSNLFTYTFNMSVGPEAADRLVIALAATNFVPGNGFSISNIRLNGVGMSIHATAANGGNCAIASLVWPTSISVTIDVDLVNSGTPGRCTVALYTLNNYKSTTPILTRSNLAGTPNITESLSGVAEAAVLANAYIAANVTETWGGGLVADDSRVVENTRFSKASFISQTNAPSVSLSASAGSSYLSLAAWR